MKVLHSEQQISSFFEEQRPRVIAYLHKTFTSLTLEDCEDLVQQSVIVLWEQITSGKLDKLTASLSTYFYSICRTNALALLKARNASPCLPIEEICHEVETADGQQRIEYLIRLEEEAHDEEDALSRRKDALVRQIVRSLPAPCDRLLWSRYRDELSMSIIAKIFHYASEAVVRVTIHKCRQKFAARFEEEVKRILY